MKFKDGRRGSGKMKSGSMTYDTNHAQMGKPSEGGMGSPSVKNSFPRSKGQDSSQKSGMAGGRSLRTTHEG